MRRFANQGERKGLLLLSQQLLLLLLLLLLPGPPCWFAQRNAQASTMSGGFPSVGDLAASAEDRSATAPSSAAAVAAVPEVIERAPRHQEELAAESPVFHPAPPKRTTAEELEAAVAAAGLGDVPELTHLRRASHAPDLTTAATGDAPAVAAAAEAALQQIEASNDGHAPPPPPDTPTSDAVLEVAAAAGGAPRRPHRLPGALPARRAALRGGRSLACTCFIGTLMCPQAPRDTALSP